LPDCFASNPSVDEIHAFLQVGDTSNVTCPPATACGERGIPGVVPGNSVLEFQVQLLAVKKR